MPLDAIPDLSDTQVIVYSRWDRSPDIIEDQVTYPIVTALLGAPQVKAVRGFSDFGYSFVYVIFEDGTDIYWARSRTLEYLSTVLPRLPQGVADRARARCHRRRLGLPVRARRPTRARTASPSCARSRTGTCATTCKSVPGVAEVAPLGGFVRQYQVNVDPEPPARPTASRSPRWSRRSARGNNDVGGRLVEFGGARVHGARPRLREDRTADLEQHRRSRASDDGVAGPRARRRRR